MSDSKNQSLLSSLVVVVSGAGGYLGNQLCTSLRFNGYTVVGIDSISNSGGRWEVGSITDISFLEKIIPNNTYAIVHAATLHKPHVAIRSEHDFINVNITGTLNLLQVAHKKGIKNFIFTSTTSVYGFSNSIIDSKSSWITELVQPIPKNIYGVTKLAAENICRMYHHQYNMKTMILRLSRFFPEEDDVMNGDYDLSQDNIKSNEYLYRRVDRRDVISSILCALHTLPTMKTCETFIISSPTPFHEGDCGDLSNDAPKVLKERVPEYEEAYRKHGWKMFKSLDRVYCSKKAEVMLGWKPEYGFKYHIKNDFEDIKKMEQREFAYDT